MKILKFTALAIMLMLSSPAWATVPLNFELKMIRDGGDWRPAYCPDTFLPLGNNTSGCRVGDDILSFGYDDPPYAFVDIQAALNYFALNHSTYTGDIVGLYNTALGSTVYHTGKVQIGSLPPLSLDDLTDGTTNKAFTATEKAKLSSLDTDANLKARANHTGAQAISTITGLQAILDDLTNRVEVLEQ